MASFKIFSVQSANHTILERDRLMGELRREDESGRDIDLTGVKLIKNRLDLPSPPKELAGSKKTNWAEVLDEFEEEGNEVLFELFL